MLGENWVHPHRENAGYAYANLQFVVSVYRWRRQCGELWRWCIGQRCFLQSSSSSSSLILASQKCLVCLRCRTYFLSFSLQHSILTVSVGDVYSVDVCCYCLWHRGYVLPGVCLFVCLSLCYQLHIETTDWNFIKDVFVGTGKMLLSVASLSDPDPDLGTFWGILHLLSAVACSARCYC